MPSSNHDTGPDDEQVPRDSRATGTTVVGCHVLAALHAARLSEYLGYVDLWTWEHLVPIMGNPFQ